MIDPNRKLEIGDRVSYACNPQVLVGTIESFNGSDTHPIIVRWDGWDDGLDNGQPFTLYCSRHELTIY